LDFSMTIYYTPEHVWLSTEGLATLGAGAVVTVGITQHAQDTLGDIVFVELPAIGKVITGKDVAGVVESVKAAADVFMPITGEIMEVNEALRSDPSLANSDPLGAGWFFKAKLGEVAVRDDLMDEATYTGFAANA
jgi:glycine cleavage system H protein